MTTESQPLRAAICSPMIRFTAVAVILAIAPVGAAWEAPARYQTAGVEALKNSAEGVGRNEFGYWEADLGAAGVMVQIPAGPFVMGLDGETDAEPEREVTLDDYWIAKYPVTVAQFRRFVEATGYRTDAERGNGAWQWNGFVSKTPDPERDSWDLTPEGRWNNIFFDQGEDHPVGSVSWNDAQAYCLWLSNELGLPFRLPTEAQWEKSARGTD